MNLRAIVGASLFSAGCLHRTYTRDELLSPRYSGRLIEASGSSWHGISYRNEKYDTNGDGNVDIILNFMEISDGHRVNTIEISTRLDFDTGPGNCKETVFVYDGTSPHKLKLVKEYDFSCDSEEIHIYPK